MSAVVTTLTLAALIQHADWKKAETSHSYSVSPVARFQLDFLKTRLTASDRLLGSTALFNYTFYYGDEIQAEVIEWPTFSDWNELASYLAEKEITYAIVDLSTAAYNLHIFGRYFSVGPSIGLVPTKDLPEPFKRIPKEASIPPVFEVYRVTR